VFKNKYVLMLQIGRLKAFGDVFSYLWIFLVLPNLSSTLFLAPIYFTFKIKNGIYFILCIGLILTAEYFVYTCLATQADLKNGIYNGLISLLMLILFFYKSISLILKRERLR